MSKIHDKLYEAAKLDGKSVKVLNKNNLYAPAIHHCAQAFEKCSKAIHAYYLINIENKTENDIANQLRRGYGHGLKKSTRGMIDYLMRAHIDNEIKNNPKLKGTEEQEYASLQRGGDKLVQHIIDIDKIIFGFSPLVSKLYDLYKNYDTPRRRFYSSNPTPEVLRRALTNPDMKYYWYIFSASLLSTFLDKLEEYSRYPMSEFSYNNVTILNDHKNKYAIDATSEMINEMINLVPLVWKQIDIFKPYFTKMK